MIQEAARHCSVQLICVVIVYTLLKACFGTDVRNPCAIKGGELAAIIQVPSFFFFYIHSELTSLKLCLSLKVVTVNKL